jgi:uncharacterized protein YyaL (SSP411 family)
VFRSRESVATAAGIDVATADERLNSARAKLLKIRSKRVWPGRDDKVLTSWNALVIRGMAVAALALGRPQLAESATRALDFIRKTLWRDGRLLATYKDGRAHLNAYLDDYVYLADAILELQQVRFRQDELDFARELIEAVLQHFRDDVGGGFFFTSDDHEALMYRTKAFNDDAIPAGNGIGASVLLRLGHLLGEPRYLDAAEQTLRAGWLALERYPHGHVSLLNALEEVLAPPTIVIVRGDEKAMQEWQSELTKLYDPHRLVIGIPSDAANLPPAFADKAPRGPCVAYVCRGSTCSAPISAFAELAVQLRHG